MKRLLLLTGFAIGYVAGSAAGRERYEQIRSMALRVRNDPQVQAAAAAAADKAKEAAPVVKDKVTGAAEVAAHEVGLAILPPLRDLDEVAYMRFASVYRAFDSLADFEAEILALRADQVLDEAAEAAFADASAVARFGGAHDPAPPPVHASFAAP